MAGKTIPMGKSRPVTKPYLTVMYGSWRYLILKAYNATPDARFARVFTMVTTQMAEDLGDTYWQDIRGEVTQLDDDVPLDALPSWLQASAKDLRAQS